MPGGVEAGPDPLTAINLMEHARWSEAEPLLRESLSILEKAKPDAWRWFDVASRLGGVLLELRRYDEAERLILAGYEGMKAREAGLPAAGKSPLSVGIARITRLCGQTESALSYPEMEVMVGDNAREDESASRDDPTESMT